MYSYRSHQFAQDALLPFNAMAGMTEQAARMTEAFAGSWNPFLLQGARMVEAMAGSAERLTRHYKQPLWNIAHTEVADKKVPVIIERVKQEPFCDLLHFRREGVSDGPPVLIFAPMSGHFATLLRGTVQALLPRHDVYITEWKDAGKVPLAKGDFGFDDYVQYAMDFIRHLGPDTHVIGVCQPVVPVLAAVSLLAQLKDVQPRTMTLMGGPVDTRAAPTAVTRLAEDRGIDWFRNNTIQRIDFGVAAGRDVYPGAHQLMGFMLMHPDMHANAHYDHFRNLLQGDGQSAQKHREFYDEYLAVMDLAATFYLQTVDSVFIRRTLPTGAMDVEIREGLARVEPAAIRRTALLTLEGEKDDIAAPGQTEAAHGLCRSLRPSQRGHHLIVGVGHYGVFNGSRFKNGTSQVISKFQLDHGPRPGA